MISSERLKRYDRLVRVLLSNCPLGNRPKPRTVWRWKWAYNQLFKVADISVEVGDR